MNPAITNATTAQLLAMLDDAGLDHETRYAVEARLVRLAEGKPGCSCCICSEKESKP